MALDLLRLSLAQVTPEVIVFDAWYMAKEILGFHHRQVMSHRYKRRYTLKWPKKTAVNKIKQEIREKLESRVILKLSLEEVVEFLNPTLRG
jgi:hypothetical protein